MGLMDKVRAQANQIAQKTQETARDSKIKFDQAQAKRRGDMMLQQPGRGCLRGPHRPGHRGHRSGD